MPRLLLGHNRSHPGIIPLWQLRSVTTLGQFARAKS